MKTYRVWSSGDKEADLAPDAIERGCFFLVAEGLSLAVALAIHRCCWLTGYLAEIEPE